MTAPREATENLSINPALLAEAIADKKIANHVSFTAKKSVETQNLSDPDAATWDDLVQDLDNLTLDEVRAAFKAVPVHSSLQQLAGPLYRAPHDYFYDFALAADHIAKYIAKGQDTVEKIKKAMGLTKDEPADAEPSTALTLTFDIRAAIMAHVHDGKIEVQAVRSDRNIFGRQELADLPGENLIAKITGVVGDQVEVIVDEHFRCIKAIEAFVEAPQKNPIPAELIDYMRPRVPGGTTIIGMSDFKVAQSYVNTMASSRRDLLKALSNMDQTTSGNVAPLREGMTPSDAIAEAEAKLAINQESGTDRVLEVKVFSDPFVRFLAKTYPTLGTFQNRLTQFLTDQNRSDLLNGWVFQLPLEDAETASAAITEIEAIITTARTAGESQLGPRAFNPYPELQFITQKSGRGNFVQRMNDFLERHDRLDLLEGITLLSATDESEYLAVKKHIKALATLLNGRTESVSTRDLPASVRKYVNNVYNTLSGNALDRAIHFLRNKQQPDLAEQLEALAKRD